LCGKIYYEQSVLRVGLNVLSNVSSHGHLATGSQIFMFKKRLFITAGVEMCVVVSLTSELLVIKWHTDVYTCKCTSINKSSAM